MMVAGVGVMETVEIGNDRRDAMYGTSRSHRERHKPIT